MTVLWGWGSHIKEGHVVLSGTEGGRYCQRQTYKLQASGGSFCREISNDVEKKVIIPINPVLRKNPHRRSAASRNTRIKKRKRC